MCCTKTQSSLFSTVYLFCSLGNTFLSHKSLNPPQPPQPQMMMMMMIIAKKKGFSNIGVDLGLGLGLGIGPVPFPGFLYFFIVSEPVSKKFGTEKSLGTGLEKNWYRKKSRNRSRKNLVPKKSLGTGLVQILGLVTHWF